MVFFWMKLEQKGSWEGRVNVTPPLLCCSVEGDAPGSEAGAPADAGGGYGRVPVSRSGDRLDQLYAHILLPAQPRPRRPKVPLRKQAEEDAIKRSRSLSESYELSSDLQDKQVRAGPVRGRGLF